MSMPIRFTKRADLIEALEARRPWAVAHDKKITANHKADEKATLDKFRADCRELLKLSYADLKDRYGRRSVYVNFDPPTCPASREGQLERALGVLAASRQEIFNVDSEGTWRTLHFLLTHVDGTRQDVC